MKIHTFMIAAFISLQASIVDASDYVVPEGVAILTEKQLLDQVIGNTFYNSRWDEYYVPPLGEKAEGKIKMDHKKYGLVGGTWRINESVMCWEYDRLPVSAYGGCYTIALDGENATFYTTDGAIWYSRGGRIKQKPGNPGNL